jgi:hypothetical protein
VLVGESEGDPASDTARTILPKPPEKTGGGKGGFGRIVGRIVLAGLLWSFWESFQKSGEEIRRAILPKKC